MSQVNPPLLSKVSPSFLSAEERLAIHRESVRISKIWGAAAIVASILTVGAFIVIFGAVLVAVFLSQDVIFLKDVFLPVMLPALLSLLLICLPLVLLIGKKQKERNLLSQKISKAEYAMIRGFYDESPLTKPDKNAIACFIEEKVFVGDYNKFYRQECLELVKKEFPNKKQRTEDDHKILEGIERAIENVKISKAARARRDEKESKSNKKGG